MADVSKIKLPDSSEVNIKDSRISGIDSTPTSGSTNLVTSGGINTALGSYLPLSGGTMTGPIELTPTDNTALSSEGLDFGSVAHLAAATSGLFGIYSDQGIALRPGTGGFTSKYGLYLTSSSAAFYTNIIIEAATTGTPGITFRRGTNSDVYADWKQRNNAGTMEFVRSVSGTDTVIVSVSSSEMFPTGTLGNNVSSLSLGSSTNQWANVYAEDGTFSGDVDITGTVTASNIPTYYSGASDPSSSLGSDGDIYLKISS